MLKKPLGRITQGEIRKKTQKIIAVGDRTAISLIKSGILPDLLVYDGKEKRKKIRKTERALLDAVPFKTIRVRNGAGTIQEEVWAALAEAKSGRTKIFVEGEEDLITIPAIIVMDGILYYGQPNKGIVCVPITKKAKIHAKKILDQMKVIV